MSDGAIDDMSDVARGCFGVFVAFAASGLFVLALAGVGITSLVNWIKL